MIGSNGGRDLDTYFWRHKLQLFITQPTSFREMLKNRRWANLKVFVIPVY